MNPIDLSSPRGMILALLPEIVLAFWGMVVLLVAGVRHANADDQKLSGHLSLVGLLSALLVTGFMWFQQPGVAGPVQMMSVDAFRFAASSIVLLGAIMAVLVSGEQGLGVPAEN